MKTSNILITISAFIVLTSLVAYDFGLRAEQQNIEKMGIAEYKKSTRFVDFQQVNIQGFNNVSIKAANAFGTTVEYGDKEAIWISNRAKDMIKISKVGNDLILELSEKGKGELKGHWKGDIVIISPRINKVSTSSFKFPDDKYVYPDFQTNITGFMHESLSVEVAAATKVKLSANRLMSLYAVVNSVSASEGRLIVGENNQIKNLKLEISGKNTAEILDTDIEQFEHQISDSASVTIKGALLTQFNKK